MKCKVKTSVKSRVVHWYFRLFGAFYKMIR